MNAIIYGDFSSSLHAISPRLLPINNALTGGYVWYTDFYASISISDKHEIYQPENENIYPTKEK